MKVLFISPYLPSEKSGHAGAKLIYQNIISLSKSHQVSLATFIDLDEENMLSDLEKNGIDVYTVNYPRNQKSFLGRVFSGFRNRHCVFLRQTFSAEWSGAVPSFSTRPSAGNNDVAKDARGVHSSCRIYVFSCWRLWVI